MFRRKTVISVCLIFGLGVLGGLLIMLNEFGAKNKIYQIQDAEIQLSDEELVAFKKCFGIEKPEALSILECEYSRDKENEYYAIKAILSNNRPNMLLKDLKKNKEIQLYPYLATRRPIDDSFCDDFPWWNIDSGKVIACYNIQSGVQGYGSAAIIILKIESINYIYMWYSNPAEVSK